MRSNAEIASLMPRYQCHKIVRAAEIAEIEFDLDVAWLTFTDPAMPKLEIPLALVRRYVPTKGDFFVIYEDGYESISPKHAFDQGYRRI